MNKKTYLYQNHKVLITAIFFFITCFIILTTATRSKAAGNDPIEIPGAESVNLQLKVESQIQDSSDKTPLANVGIKIAKQPSGSTIQEYLLFNESDGTYTFSNKITEKVALATQMNTNGEGILNIKNLPAGNYFLYESQLSAENVSFIQPISINIQKESNSIKVTINDNGQSNNITIGKGTDPVTINIIHIQSKEPINPQIANCISEVSYGNVTTMGTNTSLKIKKEFAPDTLDNWEVKLKVGVNILGNDKAGKLKEDKNGFDTYQEVTLSKKTKGNVIELNDSDGWSACYNGSYYDDNKIYVEIIEEDEENYEVEFSSNAEGLTQEDNKYSGTINDAYGKEIVITIKNTSKTTPTPDPDPKPQPDPEPDPTPETKTGDLTVRKIVVGEDKDLNTEFTFTVTLDDQEISGQYGDMEFKNGRAEFTLKDGESKTAKGLPENTSYEVSEKPVKDFEIAKENAKGSIKADEETIVKFTNSRKKLSPKTTDSIFLTTIVEVIALIGMAIVGRIIYTKLYN